MKFWLGISVILLLAFCSESITPPQDNGAQYRQGMHLLKEQGSKAAVQYFQDLALKQDGPKSLFYFAWSLFRDGSTSEAERLANVILEENDSNDLYTGHAHYLLGQIDRNRAKLEAAESHLNDALAIYEHHDKKASQSNAYVALAAVEITRKRYDEASGYLEKTLYYHNAYLAEKPEKKDKRDLAYYHELQSRIEFAKGRYGKALEQQQMSYDEYKRIGDKVMCLYAQSGLGFYRILTGHLKEGMADTEAVEKAIEGKEGFDRLSSYNSINWLMVHKCSDEPYLSLAQELRNRATIGQDARLNEHIRFALSWDCGREETP